MVPAVVDNVNDVSEFIESILYYVVIWSGSVEPSPIFAFTGTPSVN